MIRWDGISPILSKVKAESTLDPAALNEVIQEDGA